MPDLPKKVLITGGGGFIGGHVARRLAKMSEFQVRVVDIVPPHYAVDCLEYIQGNLLDPAVCSKAVRGVDLVLHFAANMGGMGFIHDANEFFIYAQNHTMTLNMISAATEANVQNFLYASSACVYPSSLQSGDAGDIPLQEDAVWTGSPPDPQGDYGLEKLHTEVLMLCSKSSMKFQVARFHNIFGPFGSYKDGREKVPAALLRKVLAGKQLALEHIPVELWGDGSQRRSFCYIEDAVEGIVKLLGSECSSAVNIGSDRAVTIKELALIAASAVGVDPSRLDFHYHESKPTGVASRNSDNSRARRELGWSPSTSLEEGMRRTGEWIEQDMLTQICSLSPDRRIETLSRWQQSQVIDLTMNTFAILLPITSRGHHSPTACLDSLVRFADSLRASRDETRDKECHLRVYIAIDHDDEVLNVLSYPAEEILQAAGISDVVTLVCHYPRGRVCSLWRHCARQAWHDGCTYFVLMGDDVVLPPEAKGWMSLAHNTFVDISHDRRVPHGTGCVAFTDLTFPGMPTFPIVHRTHLDVFAGQVVPDVFVNQDGDPFLFQLYRRFGCSRMMSAPIRNTVGGSENARYEKVHAPDWTFGTLDEATSQLENFLGDAGVGCRMLTIDVIVPCYRVQMAYLERFITLEASLSCSVMFIIIVDNPNSPNIADLEEKYGHRWDVRVRVNETNIGASASRNRGLSESAAEYALFLDDDVVPQRNILFELERSIRETPSAAGFAGNAQFPVAHSISAAAIHLAGVTYFWDIAEKMPKDHDIPWAVTAVLATRRNANDQVTFNLSFPKTGGGEDIDYCRRKRQYSIEHGGLGIVAAPQVIVTHPYWNNGKRSYWRFYMWSKGDGYLIKLYPQLAYVDWAPNSAELLLCCLVIAAALPFVSTVDLTAVVLVGLRLLLSVVTSNVLHDAQRHLWKNRDRAAAIKTTVGGVWWVVAVVESTFIRMFSEVGRLAGMLERKEYLLLGRRFDWFAGHPAYGDGPRQEERKNSIERFGLSVIIATIVFYLGSL